MAEETGVYGENHRKSLTNIIVSDTPRHERQSKSQCLYAHSEKIGKTNNLNSNWEQLIQTDKETYPNSAMILSIKRQQCC